MTPKPPNYAVTYDEETYDRVCAERDAARAEADRLRGVAVALDEYQRDYEVNAWEPGCMPGNQFYSDKMMEIVRAARAVLHMVE